MQMKCVKKGRKGKYASLSWVCQGWSTAVMAILKYEGETPDVKSEMQVQIWALLVAVCVISVIQRRLRVPGSRAGTQQMLTREDFRV